jgi:Mycothiol maleylpyruvate isomerase N-terminal domain
MPIDPSYNQLNRASTERIKKLVASLTDEQMQTRVGEHWTVSIALAHLAFWEGRVKYVLDMTAKESKLVIPTIDIIVNDISLPLWAVVPVREAARIAIETSENVDKQLEVYSQDLLEELYNQNKRFVIRALHRNEHLDEVDAALKK